jgi:sugar lactone lactonase YvrE
MVASRFTWGKFWKRGRLIMAIMLSRGSWRRSLRKCVRVCAPALIIAMVAATSAWARSGALWVAEQGNDDVVEVLPNQQKHSGTPNLLVLDSSSLNSPNGLCFDKKKNLWVINYEDSSIDEFTPSQLKVLATTSDPTPAAVITSSSSFSEAEGCALDKRGNLWVADAIRQSVNEISASQLAAGTADLTPAVVIADTTDFTGPDQPQFLAFDKSGNLWVSDIVSSQVIEFSAGQLSSSGDKAAMVVLTDNGSGSLSGPGEMAFDRKGNLWVTNYDNGTVVMFQKSDLASSGSPTPKITLADSSGSLDSPSGLGFTGNGPMWVANIKTGTISKFLPKQRKRSGTPIPRVTLQGFSQPYQITFGPVFGKLPKAAK